MLLAIQGANHRAKSKRSLGVSVDAHLRKTGFRPFQPGADGTIASVSSRVACIRHVERGCKLTHEPIIGGGNLLHALFPLRSEPGRKQSISSSVNVNSSLNFSAF